MSDKPDTKLLSKKERLNLLPEEARIEFLQKLTDQEAEALLYDWEFNGRPKQLEGIENQNWFLWLILAGRGFGKTRTGAEKVRHWVEKCGKKRIGIISPTTADLRDVIVEGESGIINVFPPWNRPIYEPTKRRITWSNGAIASLYSGEEPERLRGPQHDALWLDELAGFSSPEIMQRAWDMAMFGLRLGHNPQVIVTTTPKPVPLVQEFIKKIKQQINDMEKGKPIEGRILLTTGSSYENRTNLAGTFFQQLVQYEGTLLGRQEIHAEVLNLEEQGIVKRSWFKLWPANKELPRFDYIIQSYDTAFTEKTHNDPTAHQTWGVFRPTSDSPFCVMLLDCWTDHLKYPDLREKVTHEFKTTRYGGNPNDPFDKGQPADLILIEEKGSGITLLQDLGRAGLPVRSYNPGKMDKIQRLHAVSHLVANERCYIPESTKVPGEFRTWATEFISEICMFPNSLHDDQVDAFTQTLALLRDQSFLSVDPVEYDEEYADTTRPRHNPYAC
jgi:predicted phage terminase large subunit-like protein